MFCASLTQSWKSLTFNWEVIFSGVWCLGKVLKNSQSVDFSKTTWKIAKQQTSSLIESNGKNIFRLVLMSWTFAAKKKLHKGLTPLKSPRNSSLLIPPGITKIWERWKFCWFFLDTKRMEDKNEYKNTFAIWLGNTTNNDLWIFVNTFGDDLALNFTEHFLLLSPHGTPPRKWPPS